MRKINRQKCLICGGCVSSCPVGAINIGTLVEINEKCVNCGICELVCPIRAIGVEKDV